MEGNFIIFSLDHQIEYRRSAGRQSFTQTQERWTERSHIASAAMKAVHARRKRLFETRIAKRSNNSTGRALEPSKGGCMSASNTVIDEPSLQVLVNPSSPYSAGEESHNLQFLFSHTYLLEGKDRTQLSSAMALWRVVTPQMSWYHPGIKHALLAISLLMRPYLYRRTTKQDCEKSLEQQNKAILCLVSDSCSPAVLVCATVLFQARSVMLGDWEGGSQHVEAGSRMLELVPPNQSPVVTTALGYIRKGTEQHMAFWTALNDSTALSSTSKGQDHHKEATMLTRTSWQRHQQRFFNALVELTLAQRQLRAVLVRAQNKDYCHPIARLSHDCGRVKISAFASRTLKHIDWILGRWTSTCYLDQNLDRAYCQRLYKLRHYLDESINAHCPSAECCSAYISSASPFLHVVSEFAQYVGVAGDHNVRLFDKETFEDMAFRIDQALYLMLPMAAGKVFDLRRDVRTYVLTCDADRGGDE